MARTLPREISSSIDWTFEKQLIIRAKLSKVAQPDNARAHPRIGRCVYQEWLAVFALSLFIV